MTSRTITGTIYHPVTHLPWPSKSVVFELRETFESGGLTYPAEARTVVTGALGTFSVDLAVPDTGSARYGVRVGDLRFDVSLASGADLTLDELIALQDLPGTAPDLLQTAVDAALLPTQSRVDALEASAGLVAWYVDSASGSDANSGRSPAAAFATIGALAGRVAAGQSIMLAAGSVWREQLIISADNVSVLAYGNGSRPLLDASDAIAAGAWSKTAGRTNVYQAPAVLDIAGYVGLWENGALLARVESIALCDSTAGSYYPSADSGTITLYVHVSNGSNPGANGRVYEFSRRAAGLDARTASGTTVKGIRTRRNQNISGSLCGGRFTHMDGCLAEDGNSHNIFVNGGSLVENCEALNATYSSAPGLFVGYDGYAEPGAITFLNCYAHNSAPRDGDGFVVHTGGGGVTLPLVAFHDCRVVNCNSDGVYATAVDKVIVSGGNMSGSGLLYGLTLDTPLASIDGFVSDVHYFAIVAAQANSVFDITRCSVSSAAAGPIVSQQANTRLNVSNCLIHDSPFAILCQTAANPYVSSHNNTFVGIWSNGGYYIIDNAAFTLASDFNWFGTGTAYMSLGGTIYATVTAYIAATGQDAHSVH